MIGMDLDQFNDMAVDQLKGELTRCCGSSRWVEQMIAARPFKSVDELLTCSDDVWQYLAPDDWQEAFAHHPKIGDLDSIRAKFATTSDWAQGEQKGVASASEDVLQALAKGNSDYEQKFGYIFIVCATGKSADQMLALLQERLKHEPAHEIRDAMHEQNKITRIRLEKLLS